MANRSVVGGGLLQTAITRLLAISFCSNESSKSRRYWPAARGPRSASENRKPRRSLFTLHCFANRIAIAKPDQCYRILRLASRRALNFVPCLPSNAGQNLALPHFLPGRKKLNEF